MAHHNKYNPGRV